MTLVEKIMTIYPQLTSKDFDYFAFKDKGTILVQDNSDGNGPFIAKWEHPTLAKPTNEELQGA
jgi:hypothetical protein